MNINRLNINQILLRLNKLKVIPYIMLGFLCCKWFGFNNIKYRCLDYANDNPFKKQFMSSDSNLLNTWILLKLFYFWSKSKT